MLHLVSVDEWYMNALSQLKLFQTYITSFLILFADWMFSNSKTQIANHCRKFCRMGWPIQYDRLYVSSHT